MEKRPKPGLADLSKLVARNSKVRITPAIRIQRILAVACSETSRTAAILAFRLLQISPNEAEFVSIAAPCPLTKDKTKIFADQILRHDVDIIILESATVKTALESAFPHHSKPHFIVAPDFSVNVFEDIGVRKFISDRRAASK